MPLGVMVNAIVGRFSRREGGCRSPFARRSVKALRINQSTVFRSLTSKTELDARLFKRGCAALTLTVRGEEAVCFAARMERDVAAFERGVHRRRFDRSIRLPKIKRAAAAAR